MKPIATLRSTIRQTGAVLITVMIFLVVLTILGITSARVSGLEERMSGNMRDRMVAMQAAESALRDAERDLLARGAHPRHAATQPITGLDHFSPICDLDATTPTDDDGLCDRMGGVPLTFTADSMTWPAFTIPTGSYAAFTVDMTDSSNIAIPYGRFTGATAIAGIPVQPRYIIDGFKKMVGGESGGGPIYFYRITVRAQGVHPTTVVWLQEVFRPH